MIQNSWFPNKNDNLDNPLHCTEVSFFSLHTYKLADSFIKIIYLDPNFFIVHQRTCSTFYINVVFILEPTQEIGFWNVFRLGKLLQTKARILIFCFQIFVNYVGLFLVSVGFPRFLWCLTLFQINVNKTFKKSFAMKTD